MLNSRPNGIPTQQRILEGQMLLENIIDICSTEKAYSIGFCMLSPTEVEARQSYLFTQSSFVLLEVSHVTSIVELIKAQSLHFHKSQTCLISMAFSKGIYANYSLISLCYDLVMNSPFNNYKFGL